MLIIINRDSGKVEVYDAIWANVGDFTMYFHTHLYQLYHSSDLNYKIPKTNKV